MLPAFATTEATKAYFKQHPSLQPRALGSTGLVVSQAGFGTYRVNVGVMQHRAALKKALLSGINLIDTSTNYTHGGAEKLVGSVLRELTTSGELQRESVVVVSKVGYIQGQNYERSQRRQQLGHPYSDLVAYAPGLEHCIHPEYIEEQIGQSLKRLDLETVDLYLLHNPEYYLSWAQKSDIALEEARKEYERRIELGFRHLEEEVERGRIHYYGISSNSFPYGNQEYEFSSLQRFWQIAEAIKSAHHFRAIQLPMNLLECGAATEENQSDGKSVLQFAQDKSLAVLINRPLNAIANDQLYRLAESETKVARLKLKVVQAVPELAQAETLSRMAIRALRATAGVSSVLVGMRRQEYVEDVLAELQQNCALNMTQKKWQALQKVRPYF